MRDPFCITILRPWRLCVMSSSSWYHSTVGGGSPVATHSSLKPLEFENVALKKMVKKFFRFLHSLIYSCVRKKVGGMFD
jgi:hypothetical protein